MLSERASINNEILALQDAYKDATALARRDALRDWHIQNAERLNAIDELELRIIASDMAVISAPTP
jgi:hypothetical protein